MKILMIHWAFPGQFQYLAPELIALGHDLKIITQNSNYRNSEFEIHTYDAPIDESENENNKYFILTNGRIKRGERVAQIAEKLSKSGFIPDLVIGHFGLGETIFIKDIYPNSKVILYTDIHYNAKDGYFDQEIKSKSLEHDFKIRALSGPALISMEMADLLWTQTQWQYKSIPDVFKNKTRVIFDGIDTNICNFNENIQIEIKSKNIKLKSGDEILLYASRDLEPIRGYHRFMRALPKITKQRPNLQVMIVGNHGSSYSGLPAEGGSWKTKYLKEVQSELDPRRVHFLGSVEYNLYIELVQIARAQIYLTQPFVLSWSLFEAMSCGAAIVGSRTEPVEELITNNHNGLLADYFNSDDIADKTIELLSNPDCYRQMRQNARNLMVAKYDMKNVCLQQQLAMCKEVME